MPVEREFVSPEFVQLGTLLGCAEMIRSGITCFADMYYFEEDVAIATAQAGLRAVLAESVLKFPTPDAQFYEDSLAATREFIQRWKNHPLIVPAVAPHAPYTCTPEILQAAGTWHWNMTYHCISTSQKPHPKLKPCAPNRACPWFLT